uniref:U-box domain-containing protein n=1 Tax=Graphocephala atropunctata TaxID=36148 RepID=A0A1B6LMX3_9HEMI
MNSRNMMKSKIDDICCNNLVASVKCDKPSSDGYEVENLITNNFTKKRKGFLVERFIKPPVTVTFEFKSSIHIHHIVIFCKVGAQKSSGIELLSQTSQNNDQYETIGSGVLLDSKVGFVFHRYDIKVADKFGDQYYCRTFKSSQFTSFVNSLKIKIFRTNGTCIPALGKVEIWGVPKNPLPLKSNGIAQINDKGAGSTKESSRVVSSVLSTPVNSKVNKLRYMNQSSGTANHSTQKINICSKPISIPEDFIDPITCEIMPQPLVMPSGKVIDNSTLEAYQKAEQQWGRGPSDPFTGVPFHDSNKPIVASDLKARIDKFLSDNSNYIELNKIPRTVGKGSSIISKQKSLAQVSKLISKQSTSSCGPSNSHIQTDNDHAAPKRRKLEMDIDTKSTTVDIRHVNSRIDPLLGVSLPDTVKSKSLKNKPRNVINNFQERMDQSLESALKSTLSKLPKLTADKQNNKEENKAVVCHNCKNCDNLFSIPCSHFICRPCLVNSKQKESVCSICRSSFRSSDVQKVHL